MLHLLNDYRPAGRYGWLLSWLLLLLLGAGHLPAAQAQTPTAPFTVRATPAIAVTLPPGGSQTLTVEADYAGFASGVGFDAPVYALASQPDGKVLAGGAFTTYNGTARARLARINPDGSLDPSFTLAGTGFDGAVRVLALQADGKVLVGGEFTHYGTTARNYLLRLNANGSLDASFAPAAGPSGPVAAIVVQPDGRVFIGGNFSSYAGVARSSLARVLASGALDTSFQTSYDSDSSPVLALALQADGRLVVGGSIPDYIGTTVTTKRNYLARFYTDGTLDAAFAPPARPLPPQATHFNAYYATALAVQPDGKIVVGTNTSNATSTFSSVRRLNADGTTDFSYSYNGSQSTISALVLQADGKILVSGAGLNTGLRRYITLYRLSASGTLDAYLASSEGQPATSLAVQPSGNIWLGGSFTQVNNLATGYFAVLTAAGAFALPTKPVPGVAYQWITGATGPTLTVTAPGIYYATATLNGQTALSNLVYVNGGTYRLNAGGGDLTTKRGAFMADGYYSPSSRTGSTADPIAGTLDPALFQSERYSTNGTLSYALPVVNGTYQLVLYFAETYWTKPGQRVFDINLEGQPRLTNYDIVKKVGPRVATSEVFTVVVTDGVLNVDLRVPYERGGADQAKLSALEVIPTPPAIVLSNPNQAPYVYAGSDQSLTLPAGVRTATTVLDSYGGDLDGSGGNYNVASLRWSQVSGPTVATFSSLTEGTPIVSNLAVGTYVFGLVAYDSYGAASSRDEVTVTVAPSPYTAVLRVNAGGPALPTTRGDFAADKYVQGAVGGTSAGISNTLDPALYQTERYSTNGALHFAFDVGNGQYTVILHFAEIYWTQPGQRVFDVSLEGTKVLDKYDILRRAFPLAAVIETFPVTVTDGVLNLDLVVPYEDGGADQAKISAIEILRPIAAPASATSQRLSAAAASPLGELRLYPNPSAGACTLACQASQAQAATLTLRDGLGRVVRQQAVQLQAGANQLAVAAAGLAPGLYQLSLAPASGPRQSQKLLIQP